MHCDFAVRDKIEINDAWVVEAKEFNTDTQVYDILLRPFEIQKDL